MNNKPTLTCYGGVGAVTGANFLFETGTKRILVDCGLLQGLPSADATNAEAFDYDPASIDCLFITHGHIDHIGKVPKLVKDGFKGVIYSTEETKEISKLMLEDMAHIADSNSREHGTPALYTEADVEKSLAMWQTLTYHEPKDFGDFTLEVFNAGHILGSAMYKFIFPSGKSMMFTGDTGNSPAPLEVDTDTVTGLSYLLMDSVYGDRNHESPEERDAKFKNMITDVVKRGGTLVIPSFSLERTQVLLFELHNLSKAGLIPQIPVFLDSPLAIKVTEIYEKHAQMYNPAAEAEIKTDGDIFSFPRFKDTVETRDSREIELVKGPKIILAGSGMSTAGRVLVHEARYLPDPTATILFVGYQAPGTLGRVIQGRAKEVVIKGAKIPVLAHIETIDGFSAHKDSDHLVEFVSHTKDTVKTVFVTMGEPKSEIFLAQRLHDELGVNAVVPQRGDKYELDL
ncbi:MAG: RNA-metabolising metallo-beta-lactamase, metallo-beta-lactamase family protein [Parcubacteria group bacterium]|nr:RNA-metabolising metallo-beta-lactamase, metallo-beta-lactamase family protein [Parcubacteria group bacterium]